MNQIISRFVPTNLNIDMRKCFLPLISLLMVLFACQTEPFLNSQEASSISIDANAQTNTISFSTNVSWVAKSSDSWLKVSPSSGEGGDVSIIVSADANPNYDPRTATITVTAEGLTKVFTFIQAERTGFLLSETNFSIGSEGGAIKIPIQANIEYSLTVDDNSKTWLSVTQTKSLANYNIVLNVAKNETYEQRTGTAYVEYGDIKTTLSIKQSQLDELIISTTVFEVGSDGGEIQIPVQANVEYDCEVLESASEWISVKTVQTKGLTDYKLILKIAENHSYDGRVGQVKVSGADKESILTITQSQIDEIIVVQTEFEIGYNGGEIIVPVTTNVEYEAYIITEGIDWITVSSLRTKALENFNIVLSVSKNTSYNQRTAQLKIVGANKTIPITITQAEGVLEVNVETPGSLSSLIEGEQKLFKSAIITGSLNNSDFAFLCVDMPNLQYLDISGISNTELANAQFVEQKTIKEVALPKNLLLIPEKCFYGSAIQRISMPYGLEEIGPYAFASSSISTVQFPASITAIREGAFRNCKKLNCDLSFNEGLKTIEDSAFDNCSNLSGKITLPSTVHVIGDSAFGSCYNMTGDLIIPNGCSVGVSAFHFCQSITSLKIPDDMTEIADRAFCWMSSVKELRFPEHLKKIGDGVFAYWLSISGNLIIPDEVEYIGEGAFRRCTGLNGVIIFGRNLKTIAGDDNNDAAFAGTSFSKVYCKSNTPPNVLKKDWMGLPLTFLGVPAGSKDSYAADPYWGTVGTSMPSAFGR